MQNSVRDIVEFTKHDPAAVAGLVVICSASVLHIHVLLKMVRAGYKVSHFWNSWQLLPHYLKVRRQHGWSPWPVYLIAPTMLVGITLLVFGLIRL